MPLPSAGTTLLPRRSDLRVVRHLVARDFRIRYSRSVIGWSWSLVQPLTRLIVLNFVFTRAIPLDIDDYAAFLFVGIVSYQWFSAGLTGATVSLVANKSLLIRPGFHRASIPAVAVLTAALDAFVALLVLLAFVAVTTGVSWSLLFLPVLVALQLMLILGIGTLVSVANVYLRDVRLLVELVLQVGFYVTPIFYDVDTLPAGFQTIVKLNPMTWVLDAQRTVILEGQLPEASVMAVLGVTSSGLLFLGLWVFRRTSHSVIDEL